MGAVTLSVDDLPETLHAVGKRLGPYQFTFTAHRDCRKTAFTCAWGDSRQLRNWQAAHGRNDEFFEMRRDGFILGLISSRRVQYLVFEPGSGETDVLSDKFVIDAHAQVRLVPVNTVKLVWPVFARLLHSIGVDETGAECLKGIAGTFPVGPLWLFGTLSRIPGLCPRCGLMFLATRHSQSDGKIKKKSCLICEFGWRDARRILRERGFSKWGIRRVHDFRSMVSKNPELWMAQRKLWLAQWLAQRTCPPPGECDKCNETSWGFVSISTNGRSATWKCAYCGRKVIAKAGQAPQDATRPQSRPAIPKSVQTDVWRRDGGRCTECGSKEFLEFDHVIPLAKGGANTARNIQLLCQSCNRRKRDRDPGSW